MKVPQQEVQKIIIFRALQLGDLLCSIPAIRALRQAYPQASVTLAGLPWAKAFVERFSGYFDAFIPFPGYPGLPEQAVQPAAFTSFLAEVQAEKFDLALQMQGNGTLINPMIELFGARYTAGFCVSHDYCPNKELFLEYPNHGHEIERHIRLMNHLGIEEQGLQLEFPLSGKDYEEFAELNLPVDPMHYVCIHPGSRGSWRQWPPKYFAELADYCKKQGFEVVITGTKEELPIVEEVMSHMQTQAINVAGKTSLGSIGVLIKYAFALISNCTGVSHIASAFHTKSVVISMDGEPERWGPLDKNIHHTIDWTKTFDFGIARVATISLFEEVTFE
ncbi:glycosyltransferase family 9 protein [Cytophagaceae bacterium DM2B3-1]|uniref:Glycosyltransferase family 9 protein n=1 Tax=Xanthocytophaga flava TaxID=3048013 RepID=A0ABT7CTQ2_9BACT|nr:glycosyltransferase family 9 protein [Xanthocytophaga flavus]MDJ1496014.1 glycosyltransferase family 9 protein [Xanthocytophaga flavus]